MIKQIKHTSWVLLVWKIMFLQSCALDPMAWKPLQRPAFKDSLALNTALQDVSSIELNGWYGPEDFALDRQGNIYCGVHKEPDEFSPGAILKISAAGQVSKYLETSSWVTGIQFDKQDHLIALIHGKGLVKITSSDELELLLSETSPGQKLMAGTGLDIANDGKIYFANLSSERVITTKYIQKLILEQRKTGGVYCYDPETNQVEVISDGSYFANGVALSPDEDYLLVSETSKYRILKYWLSGSQAGSHEVLLDNLPGFPNNVIFLDNGNFLVGFTTKRNDQLDSIHPKKGMKKVVYGLPEFMKPSAEPFGMVIEYTPEGKMVRTLFDPSGEKVAEAGAVFVYNNQLYIGGDVASTISILNLK